MKSGGRSAEVPALETTAGGFQVADLQIDIRTRRVLRAGVDLNITSLSFDLLVVLARGSPDLVTFDAILREVWPGVVVSPETLTQRVKLLRQALGDSADQPRYILAVRGHGYRLQMPAEPLPSSPTNAARPSLRRWGLAAILLLGVGGAAAWWSFAPDSTARPRAAPVADVNAYRFFAQAEAVVNGTPESFRAAIALYDEALLRDPDFARALSGRAMNRAALVRVGSPLGQGLEDAQRDAQKALSLDPSDARAHTALASMAALRGQWSESEERFRKAIALSPQDAEVRARYAITLLLATGQLRKAAEEAGRAQDLAPTSSFPSAALAFADQALGEDEAAVRFARLAEARGGDPRQMAPVYASAAARRGNAIEAANQAIRTLSPALRDAGGEAALQRAHLALADPKQQPAALVALRSLTQEAAWEQADPRGKQAVLYLYAKLGAVDDLYREMDAMLRGTTYPQIIGIAGLWAPQMGAFRSDRRFQALVVRLGLIDYWKSAGPPDGCALSGTQLICR